MDILTQARQDKTLEPKFHLLYSKKNVGTHLYYARAKKSQKRFEVLEQRSII